LHKIETVENITNTQKNTKISLAALKITKKTFGTTRTYLLQFGLAEAVSEIV